MKLLLILLLYGLALTPVYATDGWPKGADGGRNYEN